MTVDALTALYVELEEHRRQTARVQRMVASAIVALGEQAVTRSEISGLPCSADVVWDETDVIEARDSTMRSARAIRASMERRRVERFHAPEAHPVDSSTFIPEEQREIIDRCGE